MPFVIDDLLLMAALGGGVGAMTSKKPLKGALLGASLGAAGAAAAPAIGGLFGAAPAAATVTPAATTGLLAGEAAAATPAAEAAYGATLLEGAAPATQAAAPIADMGTAAPLFDKANFATNGLLGKGVDAFNTAEKFAKPVMTGMQVAQAMTPPDTPAPPPPQLNQAPLNLSDILAQADMRRQFEESEDMRRRKQMQSYISNIGGGYGRTA